jgi:hypothetical protein
MAPSSLFSNDLKKSKLDQTNRLFKLRKYRVIKNQVNGRFIRIRNLIKGPKILFYQTPTILKPLFYSFFLQFNSLLFYSPYSYRTIQNQDSGGYMLTHIYRFLNCFFIESSDHLEKKLPINQLVTGYFTHELRNSRIKFSAFYSAIIKRFRYVVLFAPHYGIDIKNKKQSRLIYSKFSTYYKEIDRLRLLYKDIFFLFKPHPALYPMLINFLGINETNKYFESWETDNSTLIEDDYIVAFNLSDALIFDSVSFIGEWVYMNKPSLYLNNGNNLYKEDLIRNKLMTNHYISDNVDDVEKFLKDKLYLDNDKLKSNRESFIQDNESYQLLNPSSVIFNYINTILKK